MQILEREDRLVRLEREIKEKNLIGEGVNENDVETAKMFREVLQKGGE